jgi:potassium-transporting ATPase ATP-binding subunit
VLYPVLAVLNVMGRPTPQSTTLSAIFFNALIIPLLVRFALKGLKYRPIGVGLLLRRNLAVYDLGGIVAPFVGIKLIDLAITGLGLA